MQVAGKKIDRGVLDRIVDVVPRRGSPPTPSPLHYPISEEHDRTMRDSFAEITTRAWTAWDVAYRRTSGYRQLSKTTRRLYKQGKWSPLPTWSPVPLETSNTVSCGYSGKVWSGAVDPEKPLTGDDRMFLETIPDLPTTEVVQQKLEDKVKKIEMKDTRAAKSLKKVLLERSRGFL